MLVQSPKWGKHRNWEEAFELHLFSAKLIKYENIDDKYLPARLAQGDTQQALIVNDEPEVQTVAR